MQASSRLRLLQLASRRLQPPSSPSAAAAAATATAATLRARHSSQHAPPQDRLSRLPLAAAGLAAGVAAACTAVDYWADTDSAATVDSQPDCAARTRQPPAASPAPLARAWSRLTAGWTLASDCCGMAAGVPPIGTFKSSAGVAASQPHKLVAASVGSGSGAAGSPAAQAAGSVAQRTGAKDGKAAAPLQRSSSVVEAATTAPSPGRPNTVLPTSASNTAPPAAGAPVPNVGIKRDDLPTFSRKQVAEHNNREAGIWVIYGEGVYDVTTFVEQHPGGNKILMAAGSSVEPYWRLYAQHKVPYVYEMLEAMRIGNVEPLPPGSADAMSNDPFAHDPQRHPALIVQTEKPFNAETPPQLLVENMLTPSDIFYVRNHLPVPEVDVKTYRLDIHVPDPQSHQILSFTIDELKQKFATTTITATLQCAGNRRHAMEAFKPLKGTPWNIGAISTATFTGVRLRDVLLACGIELDDHGRLKDEKVSHVHFQGLDKGPDGEFYGASIPIETALSMERDVILAWEMNGEPLSLDHGFPLRVVVPGTIGARSVKWLNKIALSDEEYPGFWQRRDYKMFSPTVGADQADYSHEESLQDFPIQSAICVPEPHARLVGVTDDDGVTWIPVQGYALAGGGRSIRRVEVSADGGRSWHTAELRHLPHAQNKAWAWTLWSAEVAIPKGASQGRIFSTELVCRAVDSGCNVQPNNVGDIWNIRGLNNNVWHRVPIEVELEADAA